MGFVSVADEFQAVIGKCLGANESVKSKFRKLAVIIDGVDREAFQLINVDCKRGCDSCCHYYVGISNAEAEIIADFIGVKSKAGVKDRKYLSEPKACSFLKNKECSIYQVRPLACRTYHVKGVAGQDKACCDLSVEEYRTTPLNQLHVGMPIIIAGLSKIKPRQSYADIRDYFPTIEKQ